MSATVSMPKLGLTMKAGLVSKWFKAEGDPVTRGETVVEIETDKITNTVEAAIDGVLFQIVVPVGETVPIGTVLGILAKPGETPDRLEGVVAAEAPAESEKPAKAAAPAEKAETAAPTGEIVASPAAKRLARERGIDLAKVRGTGPGGRITEKDVTAYEEAASKRPKITPLAAVLAEQAELDIMTLTGTGEGGKIVKEDVERALRPVPEAAPEAEAEAEPQAIPMTGMRKAIADNMASSLKQAAQLTFISEVDVTEAQAFLNMVRARHKKDESFRVSLNDVMILATSRALMHFPALNATQVDDVIYRYDTVNMGVAVALPEGLIVPVLRNAERKGLERIAKEAREIAGRARTNTLAPEEVSGGTFTITNMTRSAVDFFTPILKPTETGILGVGRVVEKPVVRKGQVAIRSMMGLSLTFDHRVVDGAPAGEFLTLLCQYLEQPSLIMF